MTHREEAAVPAAEVAEYADAPRVRRPHGEGDAVDAVDPPGVRAE